LTALYASIDLAVNRLRSGDARGIETAVQFLEADPYCFRSGYMKADVIRFLIRATLDDAVAERLRRVVVMVVDGHDRREFRAYIRLENRVDSPSLRHELAIRTGSPEKRTARHAEWMLAGLQDRA
jgi:hypothetical protein